MSLDDDEETKVVIESVELNNNFDDEETKVVIESVELNNNFDDDKKPEFYIIDKTGSKHPYPQYELSNLIKSLIEIDTSMQVINLKDYILHPAILQHNIPNKEIEKVKPCPSDYVFPNYIPDTSDSLIKLLKQADYLQIEGLCFLASSKLAIMHREKKISSIDYNKKIAIDEPTETKTNI